MEIVALQKCGEYQPKQVQGALDAALRDIDFDGVRPGMKVLVKPNLVIRRGPEKQCTTHPEVMIAVIRALQRMGAEVMIAETPGGPVSRGIISGLYQSTQMNRVAQETGCRLVEEYDSTLRDLPEAKVLHQQEMINALAEADAVVTVGKLKTHGLTVLTGCVKNLFGLVPGLLKVETHARFPERMEFSQSIVDICEFVKPCLAVLDAVYGMEGNGPSAGTPVKIGALVVGRNPYAVDAVGARIVGVDPMAMTTCACAKKRGLLGDYQVVGASIEEVKPSSFRLPDTLVSGRDGTQKRFLALKRYLGDLIEPRPEFTSSDCTGCGVCMRSCPGKALQMVRQKDGKLRPKLDRRKCIRCFCCQELCPNSVVRVRRSPITRIIE